MSKENRHYCTFCGAKKNQSKMVLFWYPLVKKRAWHCIDCIRTHHIKPFVIKE